MPMLQSDTWARLSTAELKKKLVALRKLIDSGMLTARSVDHQITEIAFIEDELARRNGA